MTTNLTARFLGTAETWDSAHLNLSSIHGLWGGYEIHISGTGATTVRLIDASNHERRYTFNLPKPDVMCLIQQCITHDLLAIDPPERPTLVPDETETIIHITLRRRTFTLHTWANDPPHAGLRAITEAILILRDLAQNHPPIAQGPSQQHP